MFKLPLINSINNNKLIDKKKYYILYIIDNNKTITKVTISLLLNNV